MLRLIRLGGRLVLARSGRLPAMPRADCRRSRAQAALIAHSGSMLCDDVQNIAWLADCNCAKANDYSGADFLGQMGRVDN